MEKVVAKYGENVRFTKAAYKAPVGDKCHDKELEIAKKGDPGISLKFGSRKINVDLSKAKTLDDSDEYDFSGRRGEIVAGIAFEKLTYKQQKTASSREAASPENSPAR